MTVLIMTPSIRTSLGTTADPILSPLLPEESFFVITVMILGVFSMTLNTVIRNFLWTRWTRPTSVTVRDKFGRS